MSAEEGARESPRAAASMSAVEPATTTSMTAANALSSQNAVGDKETLLFSVRDVSHASRPTSSVESTTTTTIIKTVSEMTVSSAISKSSDSEMVSVDVSDNKSVAELNAGGNAVSAKKVWNDYHQQPQHMDEDEDGGRLSEENEAMNLCSKDLSLTNAISQPAVTTILSAKMRLKKQRLETEAAEVSASRSLSSPWSSHESPSPPTTATSDALHQLAEAAENRKQEEEMMEVESSTPRGSPTPSGSPHTHSPLPANLRSMPLITYKSSSTNGLLSTRLTPLSEYEVSSSAIISTLTPTASPQMNGRHLFTGNSMSTLQHHTASQMHFLSKNGPPTPSPDSAIHSAYYSPSQSPVQSRHLSGFSSPFSLRTTPSLSRNNSDASQYGGPASSVSDTSPLSPSQFSPTHSPVQSRHPHHHQMRTLMPYQHNGSSSVILARQDDSRGSPMTPGTDLNSENAGDCEEKPHLAAQTGISRQQLINSPCPVCGDKISGFHYGIFSCESCKGFFKRTVQNKKNYVCLRGAQCPVSIATRKKCPACRFDKCLRTGMKLEAIREDRTRGGRSTYQCSYTLPAGVCPSPSSSSPVPPLLSNALPLPPGLPNVPLPLRSCSDVESSETSMSMDSCYNTGSGQEQQQQQQQQPQQSQTMVQRPPAKSNVPPLLQEIMDVEHLWFSSRPTESTSGSGRHPNHVSNHVGNSEENMVQTLADMADKRLYKLVKWCKSLPLFKNILIDDQIALLINAWCELLVFSCCYRSVNSPGLIRVSNDRILTPESAREFGIEKWVEKMLNFSDQLRRLKVDYFEYVSMKVIVLLTSDASSLKEAEHVRDSQEKVVQALQQYTYTNYPSMPSKFAELLLRIPELHRVCQVGKEMLCPRQPSDSDPSGFNLLLELLRGDH